MNAAPNLGPEKYPFFSFLTDALGDRNFDVMPLAGDASSRKYFRIVHGEASWVLMVWEPFVDDENYPFLSVLEHFQKHGVLVPAVKVKSPAQGLVLLEDLGDLTLERKFWEAQDQENILPFYQQSIDELIKIHYHATQDRTACTAFKVAFDTEKLLWEMNYGRTHLLEGFCKIQLSAAESQELDSVFLKICSLLDKEERRIAHRDYHSRNIMFKLGKARIIDFQDARMGAIQYDLVSLLKDSYVDLNSKSMESLLSYYLEKRQETGAPSISRAQFDEIFEIQSVQRCFKACGSFSSFYNLRNDTRYLKYLAPTLKRVRASLAHFPEFRSFGDILEGYGLYDESFVKIT